MIEIYLNDSKMTWEEGEQYFYEADCWASEFCQSYRGHSVQDVTDVSYIYDNIALYLFEDEKDATMFRLKWIK
jgi:hypothetical protein